MFRLKLSHEKGPELISISEASRLLGVSNETCRIMARTGRFGKTVKIGSGAYREHVRIQKSEFVKFCKVNEIRGWEQWFSKKNLF